MINHHKTFNLSYLTGTKTNTSFLMTTIYEIYRNSNTKPYKVAIHALYNITLYLVILLTVLTSNKIT